MIEAKRRFIFGDFVILVLDPVFGRVTPPSFLICVLTLKIAEMPRLNQNTQANTYNKHQLEYFEKLMIQYVDLSHIIFYLIKINCNLIIVIIA